MAFLPSQDSFFGQLMNFTPQALAQSFLEGESEEDHALTVTRDFGPNPGNLRMLSHRPEGLPRNAPLVVVLHGCKQTAGAYDRGAGWSQLANRFGFALLLPEQRRGNNGHGCFNWFQPEDVTRGEGEAASIAAMIRFMLREYRLDAGRVFITGLSAGGAMTAAMLAAYPELFAAGAIIAGLPYGSAANVHEAFGVMGQGRIRTAAELGARVRAASPHHGPWPRVSIWQGDADTVVNPVNAEELVKQWSDVHGLAAGAVPEEAGLGSGGAIRHRRWRDARGRTAVELYTLPGFGHATPIDPAAPLEAARCGTVGASPFILPGGLSSSYVMAESWGLTQAPFVQPAASGAAQDTAAPIRWPHILPDAPAALRDIAGPETLLGRLLRQTGLIDDSKRK